MGRMPGPLGVHEVISSDTAMGFNRRPGPSGIEDFLPVKSEETLFKPAIEKRVDIAFVILERLLSIHLRGLRGITGYEWAAGLMYEQCRTFVPADQGYGPYTCGNLLYRPSGAGCRWGSDQSGAIGSLQGGLGEFPSIPASRHINGDYSRGGFFLHGGMWKGSAGCIDVGGGFKGNEGARKLVQAISSGQRDLVLEVRL